MNDSLSYWLDNNDIICKVDEDWDEGIDTEYWSDITSRQFILGRPLFDFIRDDITRMYIAAMINGVRIKKQSTAGFFRCDTGDSKRYWQIRISLENNGWVRVAHELLRSEPKLKKIPFEAVGKATHNSRSVNSVYFFKCSLCHCLATRDNNVWQEADARALASSPQTPLKIFYGLCPGCKEGL
jgi:hypothetical protein